MIANGYFMKNIVYFLFVLFNYSFLIAQSSSDSITIKKIGSGAQYFQGQKLLKPAELSSILSINPQAAKALKSAQATRGLGAALGYAGGALIGYPLGTALAGGKPKWEMAGVGAVLALISFPIQKNAIKKTTTAVEIYNHGAKTSALWEKTDLKLAFSPNGVGISFHF